MKSIGVEGSSLALSCADLLRRVRKDARTLANWSAGLLYACSAAFAVADDGFLYKSSDSEVTYEPLASRLVKSQKILGAIDAFRFVNIEGPFEYQDGTGIIGYVVGRTESGIVDFRPCDGAVIPVSESMLKQVELGCQSEPRSDGIIVLENAFSLELAMALNDAFCAPRANLTGGVDTDVLTAGAGIPVGKIYRIKYGEAQVVNAVPQEVIKSIETNTMIDDLCKGKMVVWSSKKDALPDEGAVLGIVSPAKSNVGE